MLSPIAAKILKNITVSMKEAKELINEFAPLSPESQYAELLDAIADAASKCKADEKNFSHG